MNDNAKKWVKALRSGNYKQGQGALHKNYTFCCLGVACDLYQKEFGDLVFYLPKTSISVWYDCEDLVLPPKVQSWLNLKNNTGFVNIFENSFFRPSLAEMNDQGKTFNEIADYIEKTPELFIS